MMKLAQTALALAFTVAGAVGCSPGTLLVDGRARPITNVTAGFSEGGDGDGALGIDVFSDPAVNTEDDELTVGINLRVPAFADLEALPLQQDIALDADDDNIDATFSYGCFCDGDAAPGALTGTLIIESREAGHIRGHVSAQMSGGDITGIDVGSVAVDVAFDAAGQ